MEIIESRQVLRVLIVEDNPLDAKVCIHRLNRAGFEIIPDLIETREQFAERLRTQDYDLILSDYGLPGWTGLGALEHLQRVGKDIPFILVTGTLGEETAVKCIKMGAADYVLKDRLARLPVAVKQALEERGLREAKRMAEEQLKRSNQRITTLLETISDTFFSLDREYQFSYLNPKAESLFRRLQRQRRELKHRLFWDEFPKGIVGLFEKHLHQAMEEGKAVEFEGFFPSLKQFYEFRAFPTADGLHVFGRDISERKELEDDQVQLIGKLQEALSRVKTLSGLLPICAGCKKIRDDQGYWKRIESFLRERSDAVFTHGLCPDCADQMYPELSGVLKNSR